ncbi:hypothetical protein AFL01nite_03790 [Aeromicrobium flavum]|uniref:Uncharacterized protein n=1 Tax=Aeromicrobium flavum TaxID=416568 RepID=A0A512HRH1_9ACTN|nr:hypothetical protein [Aeromicrobium flavum]GEO88052.1 hypothetical protein AFL01nite_03790 [Aeromicrobium flavum]
MWEILGSWPCVVVVFAVGAAALARAARRSRRALIAVAVLVAATIGAWLATATPLTIDGTTCNNRATPYGVNHIELDAYSAKQLRESGVQVDRYECRDALRTRYLLAGAGYLVLTLGGAVLVARRPRVAARD